MTPKDKDRLLTDALLMLALGANEGAQVIESQAQREAIRSTTLPVPRGNTKDDYESLGFVFGRTLPDDPLFCEVTMPAGWSKRATDHSMHNDILDAQGRRRGSFFYKGAFWDRDAILYPAVRRFHVEEYYPPHEETRHLSYHERTVKYGIVFDVIDHETGQSVFQAKREMDLPVPPEYSRDESENDRLTRQVWAQRLDALKKETSHECQEWLSAHYPNFESPSAYWS